MKPFVLAAAALAMLVLAALACFLTPSVYTVRSSDGVTVHCEVLGDYPADVERIDIVEEKSGRTVWRVKAQGDMFQLHKFDLVPGANAGTLHPFWGTFQADIPAQGAFVLTPGIGYRVSVCAADWLRRCKGTTFTL